MLAQLSLSPAEPVRLPSLGWRVLHMAALWSFFGVVMGVGTGLFEGGWINVAAHVTAALLVLPLLGVILGLLGGPWREPFVGGVTGCLMGLNAGMLLEGLNPIQTGYACLLVGGLVGATFPENFRRSVRQVKRLAALLSDRALD